MSIEGSDFNKEAFSLINSINRGKIYFSGTYIQTTWKGHAISFKKSFFGGDQLQVTMPIRNKEDRILKKVLEQTYSPIRDSQGRCIIHFDHVKLEKLLLEHAREITPTRDMRDIFRDNSFEKIAQECIRKYYLKPYPSSRVDSTDVSVHRVWHGGVHVARAAMNIDLFLEMYQKYKPEALLESGGLDLSNSNIVQLVKLAAIYHDSANISELQTRKIPGRGKEAAHADNFYRDMISYGFEENIVKKIALAIENKDANPPCSVIQKLIHDADCLEILRLCDIEGFRRDQLNIYNDLEDIPEAIADMENILKHHKALTSKMNDKVTDQDSLRYKCELAPDCYSATRAVLQDLFAEKIVLRALQREPAKLILLADINFAELSMSALYGIEEFNIERLIDILPDRSPTVEEFCPEDCFDRGCFIRAIRPYSFSTIMEDSEELQVLEENKRILSLCDYTEEELKKHVLDSKFTPIIDGASFKWRPATFIKKSLSISTYGRENTLAVIIDPRAPSTLAPFLYKKNIFSILSTKGLLSYEPDKGGKKNRKSLEGLVRKIEEMQARADGIKSDPGLHYFGRSLSHNEILTTYAPEDIATIVVPESYPDLALQALMLRAKSGATFTKFARYSPDGGLVSVDEEEIVQQATVMASRDVGILLEEAKQHFQGDLVAPDAFSDETEHITLRNIMGRQIPSFKTTFRIKKENLTREQRNSISQFLRSHTTSKYEEDGFVSGNMERLFGEIDGFSEFKEDDDEITFKFIGIPMFHAPGKIEKIKKDFHLYHLSLLQGLRRTFSETTTEEDIGPLSLDIENITNIERFPKEEAISESALVYYTFTNPEYPDLQFKAYMKEGKPVMEVTLSDDRVFKLPCKILFNIAKKHIEEQIRSLNEIQLQRDEIKAGLLEHGIGDISFKLSESIEKLSIEINISLANESSRHAAIEKIRSLLNDVIAPEGAEKLLIEMPTDTRLVLQTPYVQQIDVLVTKLSLS